MRRHGSALAALLAAACSARTAEPARVPAPPSPEVETALFLVGDAGRPRRGSEPVLQALNRELSRAPERSVAAFLGDNIYSHGLPDPSSPARPEAERRIDAQIDAARTSGARALFLAGNHDWDQQGAGGWEACLREARYVTARGAGAASFLPEGGCPGPAVLDLGRRLRLVVLDTQWWLHKGDKPRGPGSCCAASSEEDVVAQLRRVLAEAGDRRVAVLAHHPLVSGGTHGGHFNWMDHLFPLRAWKGWLWLPIPGVGSIYPLARQWGVYSQDAPAGPYRRMLEALEAVLAEHPPLVWASGHDHGLQVLDGRGARHLLVSGAGIYGHTRKPARLASTRFASGGAGFLRLDVESGGEVVVHVIEVDRQGRAAETFTLPLD